MRIPWSVLLLFLVLSPAVLAAADPPTATLLPQPLPFEVLFSIEEPTQPGNVWPPFGHADEISDRGYIVASIYDLLSRFNPVPTFAPVDYGLDALHELACCPLTSAAVRPVTLFSIEQGFEDMHHGWISDGDVLLSTGAVLRNKDLLANFGPMPPVADMGLDALFIPYYLPVADSLWPPEIWFSTERGWWDEKLRRQISDGDLLSSRGYVVATNATLLRNFHPMPPLADMGLDGVHVPRFRSWYTNAAMPPEIWFSIEKGFFDERLGIQITDGDLLSTTGKVIRTNQQLVRNFPDPTMSPIARNWGLDAVYVRGRNLIQSVPPMNGTVPRVSGNTIWLIFDGALELPADASLIVTSAGMSLETAGVFDVSLATTHLPDDTLVLVERGAALVNAGSYRLEPTESLDVEPFVLEVRKVVADITGDAKVNVFDLQRLAAGWNKMVGQPGYDPACDLSGDGKVNVLDLQVMATNWSR